MKRSKFVAVILILITLFVASMFISSTNVLRLTLAKYYVSKKQNSNAIHLYKKILRKNTIKSCLQIKDVANINYALGALYEDGNYSNTAIKYYMQMSKKSIEPLQSHVYSKDDYNQAKLLPVALLEAGRFNEAANEFKKLENHYPLHHKNQKLIKTANYLRQLNIDSKDEKFFFIIGDTYIKNQLFDEARGLLTKRILDYGLKPIDVLNFLSNKYARNAEVNQKIWGKNIYVTLEDFEDFDTQFMQLGSLSNVKTLAHYISKEKPYKGQCSEFFRIGYREKQIDYWVKNTRVALDNSDLSLGIRFFVSSNTTSVFKLNFNIIYPKQDASGTYPNCKIDRVNDKWTKYSVEDISTMAKIIASRPNNNWNTEGMFMDKIILDTQRFSGEFYIDNIELYISQ